MSLPPEHFLSLPRQGAMHLGSVPDTSTLAAHDFDVDVRTGFMPPQPPCSRLPWPWEPWEQALEDALMRRLKLGERRDLSEGNRKESACWRQRVQNVSVSSAVVEILTRLVLDARPSHRRARCFRNTASEGPPCAHLCPAHLRPHLTASVLGHPHPDTSFCPPITRIR